MMKQNTKGWKKRERIDSKGRPENVERIGRVYL